MIWLPSIITGAILTAFLGSFFRANPFHLSTWGMVLVCLPLSTLAQFAFALAFSRAPVFFVAWFTGSAACAIGAFACSRLIFGEPMGILDLVAIGLVLAGAAILSRPA